MSQPRGVVLLTSFLLLASTGSIFSQSASNVAVVINDRSPESQRVGEHYARARGLPPSNVFRIDTDTDEIISRDEYVRSIEGPLGRAITRAGLQDRLHFIVLTKGMPLRIAGTTGLQGTAASVDSELTLLYRRLTGQAVPTAGMVDNPYFMSSLTALSSPGTRDIGEARHFSHRDHDIYLVTRLDGFTLDDAMALVDRAQAATQGIDGQVTGKIVGGIVGKVVAKIVLDQRAIPPASQGGDEWLARAARLLEAAGQQARVVLETTPQASRDIENVIGRSAWGATDPSQRTRISGMTFAPGAIASNIGSFDARTFRAPPVAWLPTSSPDRASWFEGSGDGLIGDLIREGVTGVAGQAGEAYLRGAVRPDILFPAYLAGFTLAEAFYLATPVLSWQTVVIGDPLAGVVSRDRLTQSDLEEGEDRATGLPALFGRRRLAAARAANTSHPDAVVELLVLADTHLSRDNLSGAREALGNAVALAPGSIGLLLALADLAEKAGARDEAIGRYERIIEIDPANVVALNNLAYAIAVGRNRPTDALPFARKAASLAPRSGVVIDTLGWIEHLLGNHAVAAKLCAEAVRLAPDIAEIRLHAAIVYAAAGQREQSQAELARALKLDSSLAQREEVRRLKEPS